MSSHVQKITPFLWFDQQAEEAATFYISVFDNSNIESVTRYGESGPGLRGSVMTVAFELDGQRFTWLKDKYGLSWQGVPSAFIEMMKDQDTARKARVMQAMMQMTQFDIAALEKAYQG
jgi:predicted 3-demethylubiquinone-9 3-methyltransferase (glyoxalase superfamily)